MSRKDLRWFEFSGSLQPYSSSLFYEYPLWSCLILGIYCGFWCRNCRFWNHNASF